MTDNRPYWKVVVSLTFSILATVLFVFFGVQAIGFFMPFVIGWILSSIATPLVNWLEKHMNIVKKLGTAIVVILVLGAIVGIIYFVVVIIVREASSMIKDFPQTYAKLLSGLDEIERNLSGFLSRLPKGIVDGFNTFIANIDDYIADFVSAVSEPTFAIAGNIAKRLPSIIVGIIVAMMSAYFFTVQREDVIKFLKKVSPKSVQQRMTLVADNFRYAVGGYFKAQFKIMGVVFIILTIGFFALKIRYAIFVALCIAFLDFLPFFGTGTALIPWAVYMLFTKNFKIAIVLMILYGVTQVVRQIIQPKLVGDSMGMNPIVTLMLLYIGYRIGSILGLILAVPVGMVIINMIKAGAFDYILDDVKILVKGVLSLRNPE